MVKTQKTKKTEKLESKTLKGLDQINEVVKGLKLQVPKLRELPNLTGLKDTVAEKIQAVCHIQEDVANAVKFICDVARRIASYKDRLSRKIVASETTSDIAEMEEYLEGVLTLEDEIFRSAAALAYLKSVLSGSFETHEEALAVLANLVDRGLLVQAGREGKIPIGYQRYDLGEDFGLDNDDEAEVAEVIAKFSRSLMILVRQRRQEQAKEMEAEADIELADAMDKDKPKNGKCLVEVPAESYVDGRDGQEKWRGGGSLLVEFRDKEVAPLCGVGSIENAIKAMAAADVRLARYTLAWDMPPGSGKAAFERVLNGVMDNMGLKVDEAEKFVNQMKALWWLIHRALRALREKASIEKLKEELHKKADITAPQLFGLNGSDEPQEGTACLEFAGTFHQKANQPALTNLIFLATGGEEAGEPTIEVTEVPKHLEKTLGVFVGKKFPMRDNFSSCPAQLGRILKGIRGQLDLAHEIAKE